MKQDRFSEWLSGIDELTAPQRSKARSVLSDGPGRLSAPEAAAGQEEEGGLLGVFEFGLGELVGNLKAIRSEFPEFRSGEVRLELFVAKAVQADPAAFLALESRQLTQAMSDVQKACSGADKVAAVLNELREGLPTSAGRLWKNWKTFNRPSDWR